MGKKTDNAIGLYMLGIKEGRPKQAVAKYIGAAYKQHSTGVKDGKAGFVEFFEDFIKRCPKRDIQVVRTIEDGKYVFVHVLQTLNDGETQWVTADFFDTDENDRIIEHWDVISAYKATTPSGHTSIDGATMICDEDKTEANKQRVRDFILEVLCEKSPQNVDAYISNKCFIQHNERMPDGLESFKAMVMTKDKSLIYDEIVLLVGQGNFVASLCKASEKGEPYAQVDIFRIEDGFIVEHWDNAEPVPSKDQSVNSGKF
jgi:predicted SnoaL-like aldol condensation-catalyzing enzyme